ncbi:hypothetical protein C0992_003963 [Termitomyces sp. T32_za158]|nr:hypothetical protein C0992_003963 [Termitomyces sp. T32_za158]
MERLPKNHTNTECLLIVKAVTRELWDAKVPEMVERVCARYHELKQQKEERKNAVIEYPTPEQIAKNLDDLLSHMGRFLEFLHQQTGWNFSCLMGGPDPSIGGEIHVASWHVGETPSGKDFAHIYGKFADTVMEPYSEFLDKTFWKAQTTAEKDSIEKFPGKAGQSCNEDPLYITEGTSSNDGHPSITGNASLSQTSFVDALSEGKIASPAMVNRPSLTNLWNRPDSTSLMSELYSMPDAVHTANNYKPPDQPGMGGYDFGLSFPFDGGLMSTTTSSNEIHPSFKPQSWTDASFNFLVMNSLFSAPSMGVPNSNMFDMGSSFTRSGASSSGVPVVTKTTQSASVPVVMPPVHEPAVASLTTQPASVSVTMPPVQQPAIAAVMARHSPPTQSATTAAISGSALDGTQSVKVPVVDTFPAAVQTSSIDTEHLSPTASLQSRSGRTIIPSTRAEQLNKIGDALKVLKTADRTGITDPELLPPPQWFDAALAHLGTWDLGDEWRGCIVDWRQFESTLNYHNGKGLCTKDCPSEWTRWTTKSRRAYNNIPVIMDPMEFGLAFVKWWKGI